MRPPYRRVLSATEIANDESWGGRGAGKMSIFETRNAFALAGTVVSCTPICVLLSSNIFVWFFYYCRFGFDCPNEGYYMNWISRPFEYDGLWLGRGEGR